MNIIEIINKMEQLKKQNNVTPSHVLFIPLSIECCKHGFSKEKLSDELNKLYKAGKVKVGQTINDKYITVI